MGNWIWQYNTTAILLLNLQQVTFNLYYFPLPGLIWVSSKIQAG